MFVTNDDLKDKLRALRIEAGLSQRALAEKLGYTQGWVNKVETGARGIDVPVIEAWATACNHVLELKLQKAGAISEVLSPEVSQIVDVSKKLSPEQQRLLLRLASLLDSLPLAHRITLEGLLELWGRSSSSASVEPPVKVDSSVA